jgi:MFS family permease
MPTATPVPSAGLSRATASSAAALIAALIGLFVTTLDALIVSVALPSIRHDLGGGITGQQWVIDGYTLALAALLLSAGTIADRIGARQALGWGLALFLAASAACGFAPNLGVLIAARLAQGAGAAVVMPTTLALIRETFALTSGKLSAKYGPKPPMLAGQLCMAGGLGLLCLVPATAPVWLLAVLMMPVAFGAALAVPAKAESSAVSAC